MKSCNFTNAFYTKLRSIIVINLVAFSGHSIFAQSTIIALRFNGQNVNSAKVNVMPPGKGGNLSEVKKGDQLTSGTKLIIPPKTIVMLQSPGGKQACSSTTGQPMEYTVEITARGENHAAKGVGAQIENTVTKTVGYNYRVNNGRGTTAASKGTVFTFTDLSQPNNEQAKITTEEGAIKIIDEVPVRISGVAVKQEKHGRELTKSVSHTQAQGEGAFTSSNQPVVYASYDQAIDALGDEVNSDGDPDELADDLTCLGELLMDDGKPGEAIAPFRKAVNIYEGEYGPEDWSTIEAKLSLAEALVSTDNANQQGEGTSIASDIIKVLLYNLSVDQEDLNYVREDNDEEAEQIICDDIIDTYGFLGWAYDLAGNENMSNQYYDKMDKGCE